MNQDGENKASKLCECSSTCVWSNTHVEAQHAPCEDALFEVVLSASFCFTISKVLMVLPVGMNSNYPTSLTSQTTVGMILTAGAAFLNILVLVILCDWTPLAASCTEVRYDALNLSLVMILLKNSPVSHSRRGRNYRLMPICFHFISLGAVVAPIPRASVGSRICSHCLQSFASNIHFVLYSLLRNTAFFIHFVKTVPVSFVGCTSWPFASLLGRPVEV